MKKEIENFFIKNNFENKNPILPKYTEFHHKEQKYINNNVLVCNNICPLLYTCNLSGDL